MPVIRPLSLRTLPILEGKLYKMHIPPVKVLYVDDEPHNLIAFVAAFRRKFDIYTAQSAAGGLRVIQSNEVHVIISDQRMPEMTGIEFFESIVDRFPDPVRILMTGYSDITAVIGAINKGQVYKYLEKPWDEQTLSIFIEKAFEVYRLRAQNKALTAALVEANHKLERMARRICVPELQLI